jgi:hypothetical protein
VSDAAPIDEKLFYKALDAATDASARSRGIIYFAFLLEFFCLFAIRETRFPRWDNARLGLMQSYSTCVKDPKSDPNCGGATEVYQSAKLRLPEDNSDDQKYYKYFDGSDCLSSHNPNDKLSECKKYLVPHPMSDYEKFASREQALIMQSVSDLAVPIPILGLRVDTNDLWYFAGPITIIVLLVLLFTLRADMNSTSLANKYAQSDVERRELVAAIAVLGRGLAESRKYDIAGFHVIRWSVILLPIFNSLALLFLDFVDKEGALVVNQPLEEVTATSWPWPFLARDWSLVELSLEAFCLILVIIVAIAVYRTSEEMIATK